VPQVPAGISRKAALRMVTEDLMLRIAHMMPDEERGVYAVLKAELECKLEAPQRQPEGSRDV
jgi:hypothetical protein